MDMGAISHMCVPTTQGIWKQRLTHYEDFEWVLSRCIKFLKFFFTTGRLPILRVHKELHYSLRLSRIQLLGQRFHTLHLQSGNSTVLVA